MSMVALISTVTNRSRRITFQEVISASLVNANTIYDPAIELFTPHELAAAHVVNAATLYAASAEIYEPMEVVAAYFTNAAATVYAGEVALIPPPGGEQQLTAALVNNSATIYAASLIEKFSPPSTSYTGYLATGDRRLADMNVLTNSGSVGADVIALIDGVNPNNTWYFLGGQTSVFLRFPFVNKVLITEARMIQGNTSTHGTWKWQGSNDGVNYTDIGGTFTLGGATTQLQTTQNGNTTYYNTYRLLQVGGTTSGSPYVHEFDFKLLIEAGPASFDGGGAFAKGNRSGTIGIAITGFSFLSNNLNAFIDGAFVNNYYTTGGATTAHITFDFGSPVNIRGAQLIRSNSTASGDWKLQGSTDGTTFVDLSDAVTMNSIYTKWFAYHNSAYRYYRLRLTSGTASGSPYWQEVQFAQGSVTIYKELVAAHVVSVGATIYGPLIEKFTSAPPGEQQATAALVTNTSTVYAAASAELLDLDPLWSNVIFVMDTRDHSAAAEGQRLRHHSADSSIGQSIPVSNAYYTTAQKLAGRDYSIGGGATSDLTTIFGLDLNAGAFTIEGRVRRSGTGQSLLMHQGPGSSVFRFGFEAGNNARLMFSYTTNGATWITLYSLSAAVSATHAWRHIAADRGADNVLRLFVDGVMVAKSTLSSVVATPIDTKLNVGANLTSGGSMFMDDVRVTLGANRYGADTSFTPPAAILRGPSPDEDWSNVVALQRFDARAGATIAAFADASPAALYVDGAAGVTVVTGTPHTPTAIDSAGGGYVMSKAGAAGSNLSGGAVWTIEARARLANVGDVSGVACAQETAFATTPNSTDKQWRLGFSSDAKPYFEAQLVGGSTFTLASVTALTKDVWFNLAADCDGSIVRLYVDGDMVAKGTMSAAIADGAPSTKRLYTFGGAGSGGAGFPGSLDEVRVTKNVARYNSDAGYSPAVGRFPAY
ncbi:MAG: LamG-like jellyroll fold domain-containing protein [Beijerinckiaceae bacterium]|nr:LamG-like jellyroll fold domain-containing protein [Beijerinckiaceae bacterium]